MLECSSSTEAGRILSLNRRKFGDVIILMDILIPNAARSSVLLESEVSWVVVRGLPLHLRSSELFGQIGNFCGGFLDSEEGNDLNSVRIKIQSKGTIPEIVNLLFKERIFPVSVHVEEADAVPPCRTIAPFKRIWKAKGKKASVESSLASLIGQEDVPCSSGSKDYMGYAVGETETCSILTLRQKRRRILKSQPRILRFQQAKTFLAQGITMCLCRSVQGWLRLRLRLMSVLEVGQTLLDSNCFPLTKYGWLRVLTQLERTWFVL
ncbi:hypothetical protein LINGRAHAP2_LOCUS32273 [Linum grandiflorum]